MRKPSSTNYANERLLNEACPMNFTLNRIGGRWKLPIIWQLSQQSLRFGELCKKLDPISQKVLNQQLKELEQDGLVIRTAHDEQWVSYRLSANGKALAPVLDALLQWGIQNQEERDL